MSDEVARRALLVAPASEHAALAALIDQAGWGRVDADSLERARFVLQAQSTDAIVLGGALAAEGLAWVGEQQGAPPVIVAVPSERAMMDAVRHGAIWVPLEGATEQPGLLGAGLEQALRLGQQRRRADLLRAQVDDCQARIDRLLSLLWEASPTQGPAGWFSQRYMLHRLDEEVERARRHNSPLCVVLGEMVPRGGEALTAEQSGKLASWAATRLGEAKRRSDVAGQYGLHAFMLLLPQARPAEAVGACRRLSGALAHDAHDDLPPAHAHFGVASLPQDTPSVPALLSRAEQRLARAPGGGVEAG